MKTMIVSICIWGTFAQCMSLNQNQSKLYSDFNFVALRQSLIQRGQIKTATMMEEQEDNLKSCRSFRNGHATPTTTLNCMKFFNNERQFGIHTEKLKFLASDLDIICKRSAKNPQHITKILKSKALVGGAWPQCSAAVWEQVYLTTYANFEADDVRTLALVRQAEASLPKSKHWQAKVWNIIRGAGVARDL